MKLSHITQSGFMSFSVFIGYCVLIFAEGYFMLLSLIIMNGIRKIAEISCTPFGCGVSACAG